MWRVAMVCGQLLLLVVVLLLLLLLLMLMCLMMVLLVLLLLLELGCIACGAIVACRGGPLLEMLVGPFHLLCCGRGRCRCS